MARMIRDITLDVCRETGVRKDEILSATRGVPEVAEARQLVMMRARDAGMTFSKIGRYLGRDHSTVYYGVHACRERMSKG